MAKTWVVLLSVGLAACGSNVEEKPSRTPGVTRVPTVGVGSAVVAKPRNPPPVLILLDASNVLRAARISSWDLLSTKDPFASSVATSLSDASGIIWDGRATEQPPGKIYEAFRKASLAKPGATARFDDPPPPEEEDDYDDEDMPREDYPHASYFEEGKMGRKEGQYRMEPVVVAEEAQRIARELARHELDSVAGGRTGGLTPSSSARYLEPQASTVAEWVAADELEDPPLALLLAAPDAKASDFITVVRQLRPLVAVNHGGKVRPLRLETVPENNASRWYGSYAPPEWIELTLGQEDMMFEAVPEMPVALPGPFDQAAFVDALDRTRKTRELEPLSRVDVLVDPNVSVQRLIDVLVALDQAGVKMIGLGERPANESAAAALRGRRSRGGEVSIGQPNAQGDLDKAIIRRYVKRNIGKIRTCYTSALWKMPGLSGTVQTQFFITPNGNVATSSGSGVDPDVANCVASVIKAIEFPKPKGGGGVQVNYPFTFRS